MHNTTTMKFIGLSFGLIFLFNTTFAQNGTARYKSEIDLGGGTVISTFLDFSSAENTFKITSPKNADVRIMGGKVRLGRMMGKVPKKGTIVTISGTKQADSLIGQTAIPMFGKLGFKGILKEGTLSGELLNTAGEAVGTVKGTSSKEEKMDYSELYPKVMTTIKENIYSKEVLQTPEWKQFEKKLAKLFHKSHDDIELFFGFSILSQKLPFTHLNFLITQDTSDNMGTAVPDKSVFFEEKNPSTAYLQIKNFSTSADELTEILPKIVENTAYKNLIIDLRNNGGGGIDAAFAFAKYIVTEDLEVGYFPTNKLAYSGFQPELFNKLPEMQPKSTNEFGNELRVTPGVKLIFKKPSNPVFTGKLYILTNGNTASTCEPIVYALKSDKRATIIGERTRGAMLSAFPFVVSGKYLLILPIGDFYTYDGVRLDKAGVAPDIEVKSEEALTKALDLIQTETE